MAQVIPKLNLNKTPSLVEDNSLIFAKNIRLDIDGTIHRDYGTFPMSIHKGKYTKELVNYEHILKRIIADLKYDCDTIPNIDSYYKTIYNNLDRISGRTIRESVNTFYKNGKYKIVGVIASSNEFYLFINGTYDKEIDTGGVSMAKSYTVSCIVRYDEKEDKFYPCNCNWTYSGGTIIGCVINNLFGEKILNIGETDTPTLVPLKCINLSKSTINDDENIYTQTPNIPITNLNYGGTFNYSIPNGVYQFFVRYKIRDNFYTDWFPASKELFVGNTNIKSTSFGGVKYTNTHRDSDTSFKFIVEHLFSEISYNYKSFQIGFILSHDGEIVARAWKHFNFNVGSINFDYDARDAYEIEVIDLTKYTYQLYNIGNITSFKNKLYISNYKETEFNDPALQTNADNIVIQISTETAESGYAEYPILEGTVNGKSVITGLKIDNNDVQFSGVDGIINRLLNKANNNNTYSVKELIEDSIGENSLDSKSGGSKDYEITCDCDREPLDLAQDRFRRIYRNTNEVKYSDFNYSDNISSITVNNIIVESNLDSILQAVYNKQRYLNNDCIFIDNNGKEANNVTIVITRGVTFKVKMYNSSGLPSGGSDIPEFGIDDDIIGDGTGNNLGRPVTIVGGSGEVNKPNKARSNNSDEFIQTGTYTQIITIDFTGNRNKYATTNTNELLNYTTLIPYQKYKFYIHFVKQNGEITNGYYCGGNNAGIKEVPYYSDANSVIYPKFTNIVIPDGYVACFFSILHVGNNVSTVFNIKTDNVEGESSCIDINAGLVPGNNNITIRQEISNYENTEHPSIPSILNYSSDVQTLADKENENDNGFDAEIQGKKTIETHTAKYNYSSDSSNIRYFGADGILQFDKESGIKAGKLAYVVNDYVISEADDVQLIKCTPFIKKISNSAISFSEFANMNLLGYICKVYPLNRDRTIKFYTDGSTVFLKKNTENAEDGSGTYFKLIELRNHLEDTKEYDEKIVALNLIDSSPVFVYSNYNLNYLTLSEDPVESYKTYYQESSETISDKAVSSGSIVLRLFKSLTMSSIYELPAMYKNYTRKIYSTYKEDEITEFNNTVRSSELEGDESTINIFKFDANDYYNIPTNRGIIVNMVSIGDAILVHTEDSMFKFSGTNTLQSSDGEIQPAETNVFDTGVNELFGSDFGFAGLQNKTDSIITENGYIFFDRDSRVVYMYSGQGQIHKLSDNIEKLFRHKDISKIYFGNDYYNNRFFVCIIFIENDITYPVTLSFNISENIKSFVSLHDFYFHKSFNTKTKCYFLTDDNNDICIVDKEHKSCYTKLELIIDKTYPAKLEIKTINLKKTDSEESQITTYNMRSYDSIIDIMCNTDFETVKTLNAVNWSSNIVETEFIEISTDNIITTKMAEDINKILPCKYMRIYTDTCISKLLDFSKVSNNANISSAESYMYPRFNQGYWSFNYFRNIQNSNGYVTPYNSDQNSLIEGRYFVTRFIFDTEFKFEAITLNYTSKL